jgi:hypothetical protein
MKTFFYFLVVFCLLNGQMNGQLTCSTKPPATATAATQPSTCIQFLKDFTPQSSDCTLIVNVNMYRCQPTGNPNSSVWGTSTAANADTALSMVNRWFADIKPAFLNMGTPYVSKVKIKFRLNNFTVIVSPSVYTTVATPAITDPYANPNCINVFYGSHTPSVGATPWSTGETHTIPVLPYYSNTIYFSSDTIRNIAGFGQPEGLMHELCHALGLNETRQCTPANVINYGADADKSIIFPQEGCCNKIIADDYVLEDSATVWGIGAPCSPTTSLYSNNIMAYNWACKNYLSPQQMAIMHYMLRTYKKNILHGPSYLDHLVAISALDYTVPSTQTWSNDRHFHGDVIVPLGVHLTIQCLVSMSEHGKIVVKPGGWLTVQGGTVTNISGHWWDGIQVAGTYSLNQTMNSSGFANFQGLLEITNGGLLTNAGTACMNYTTDANDNVDYQSTGGIIRAYQGKFYNNMRDVEFLSYPNFGSNSIFKACDFKTLGTLSGSQLPFAHVTMWDVTGINFLGCNFEHAAGTIYGPSDLGVGILTCDASYNVSHCGTSGASYYTCSSTSYCTFKNLTKGVWVTNVNTNRAPYIVNSEFTDNTQDAIYIHNGWNFTINNNLIHVPAGKNGIYLNHSRFYTIKNNLIDGQGQSGTGIYAWQAQNGAHRIYRNTFSDLLGGIIAVDNNKGSSSSLDGLKMNCNVFNTTANQYDIAMGGLGMGANAPAVMKTQGVINTQANAFNVVRNIYGASCGIANKWQAWGNGTNTLVIDHGTNSDAVTQPTPSPVCSSTILNVVVATGALNYTADCVTNPLSSAEMVLPGSLTDTYNDLNTYLSALVAQEEDADLFELEATLGAKLNAFALDTAATGPDSLIAVLNDYGTMIPDADLQKIFAHMHKNDHAGAETLAGGLATGREDWKEMLQTVADLYQETGKIYSLAAHSGAQALMEEYASDPYRDGGSLAQALLFFVQGVPYTEPRPLPEGLEERRAKESADVISKKVEGVQVYPNPTNAGVTISYNSPQKEAAQIEVTDLLGRIIYTNFIDSGKESYIDLAAYSNGVYVITVSQHKEIIHKQKLVKQD